MSDIIPSTKILLTIREGYAIDPAEIEKFREVMAPIEVVLVPFGTTWAPAPGVEK
jgi:hypothetical protein